MKRTLEVVLNGTDTNPFHRFGCTQNPFPQSGEYASVGNTLKLQSLGGDPIPNTQYIRDTLKGFSSEFVELCCKNFKPGELVRFTVYWEDGK